MRLFLFLEMGRQERSRGLGGRFAFPFEPSMCELLAVEREGDENITGDCDAYTRGRRGRYFREIDVVGNIWEGVLDAGR